MHGEYKVPGGKLVVVDFDAVDGALRNVRVAGDFFLEPDEALEAIDRALEGAPTDTDARALGRRIEAALPEETMMVGFSAEAVGVAVRRALSRATTWRDYEWRLIQDGPHPPEVHMALDEVLIREVAERRRPPTLRFWEWDRPSVVIGSFQSLRNEVDPDGARRHGVTVVRRISGGGAMFQEPGNSITYSLYAPAALVQGMPFADSYAFLDDWVLGALAEVGVEAWYQPLNDITSKGGKIAGAAQKRITAHGSAVLHHTMMAYDIDAEKMTEVLRIGREKMSDKGTKSAQKRVDPLRRQTGLPREKVMDAMTGVFRARHGLVDDEITAGELALAQELAVTKFGSRDWTARIP
ncbi:lipoate--protein ligase family protein [Nocardiopsis sp. CNT-189]|uniref:lipoate--protein ligase family protein n=1 Tax=Nocardiopsis oceanisediminis TaxID=2816862 RepID=UPI003B3027A4